MLPQIVPQDESPKDVPIESLPIAKPVQVKTYDATEWRNLIATIAAPAGVSIDLVERIIIAESGGNPDARNKTSSATGLTQILIGTWNFFECYGDRTEPTDNIRCAVKILKESGEHHWDASAHAWKR